MRELRQHLRKYLMVMIPGQEKPVFWRFYDPRNVWDVLGTFDNWRLHVFLGPITKLKTLLWERKRLPALSVSAVDFRIMRSLGAS